MLINLFSPVWFHIRSLTCALIGVPPTPALSYMCSVFCHVCSNVCALIFEPSQTCGLTCVVSCVCVHACVLMRVLSRADVLRPLIYMYYSASATVGKYM